MTSPTPPPPSSARETLEIVTSTFLGLAALQLLGIGLTQNAGPFGFGFVLAVLTALPGLATGLAALALRLRGRRASKTTTRAALAGVVLLGVSLVSLPLGSFLEDYRHERSQHRVVEAAREILHDCAHEAVAAGLSGQAIEVRYDLQERTTRCFRERAASPIREDEGWSVSCGEGADSCELSSPRTWYGPTRTVLVYSHPELQEALAEENLPPLALLPGEPIATEGVVVLRG